MKLAFRILIGVLFAIGLILCGYVIADVLREEYAEMPRVVTFLVGLIFGVIAMLLGLIYDLVKDKWQ